MAPVPFLKSLNTAPKTQTRRLSNFDGFRELVFSLLESQPNHTFKKIAIILWAIWRSRNWKIWKNNHQQPVVEIYLAMSFFHEWLSVRTAQHDNNHQSTQASTIWSPPLVDLSNAILMFLSSRMSSLFCVGMCLRDHNGTYMKAPTHFLQGIPSVAIAEVVALHKVFNGLSNSN
ncbi:hypothetical protein JHK82_024353 [Glycine max]|nr:hypothetical protein JHK82_024353 [Glycine max]